MRVSGLTFANNATNSVFTSKNEQDDKIFQPHQQQQHANFTFAHRRLLFEEVMRTMIMILPSVAIVPFLNTSSSSRDGLPWWMNPASIRIRILQFIRQKINRIKYYSMLMLPSSIGSSSNENGRRIESNKPFTCAICSTINVTIPYGSKSCQHIFCYSCLRHAVTDNLNYPCPECGMVVKSSYRL